MKRIKVFMSMFGVSAMTVGLVAMATVVWAEGSAATGGEDGIVAYYFHGNVRCATCKKIEAYADEAVHTGFADMLQNGSLAWRVANVEEPENEHFVQDFQLVTRSVVLAEYKDGNLVRWKNLDKVWQMVRSKDSFVEYVQREVSDFVGAS